MTVLAKPSLTVKKSSTPYEEKVEFQPGLDEEACSWSRSSVPNKRYKGAVLCLGVVAALLLLLGVITAMQIYEQVANDVQRHNRYQGFCSIPLSRDIQMLEQRKAPLRWRATENAGRVEPEIQVINLMDEEPEHLLDLLREVLDIDVDESLEKISVFNNGHLVSFVHDFGSNVTGIVDDERCFTMELDPELVLQPEMFVFGLQHGDAFDVTRARAAWRGELPPRAATDAPRGLRDKCAGRQIYQLHKDDAPAIRKRSADAPPHDYMQFAGKRIQEIEISNLAELLQYEQNTKLAA